ncbi:GCC2 and GCC3, putative, partial [Hepatocystis sp. ex Piliocolobus tephrosceles]
NYYKINNFKKIKNISEYNDTDKNVGCYVKRPYEYNIWKIYHFEKCPDNYYCAKNSYTKNKCPLNSVKTNFQKDKSNCFCKEGYYFKANEKVCAPCPKGTYKNFIGNKGCIRCPQYFTTLNEHSSSLYDCTCMLGYYFNTTNEKNIIHILKDDTKIVTNSVAKIGLNNNKLNGTITNVYNSGYNATPFEANINMLNYKSSIPTSILVKQNNFAEIKSKRKQKREIIYEKNLTTHISTVFTRKRENIKNRKYKKKNRHIKENALTLL